jgi:pimeloyl-ACP methyl ester carboxylesterase
MEKGFLKYENSKVHFYRFGNGNRLLIALHGFADEGAMFLKLEESLKESYTVYSLDLPFHGLTEWDKEEFDEKDISVLFKMILQKENKERFDLMGFSFGGRIVQKMLFEWIPQVDKVFLIAPDGLKTKWLSLVNLMPRWFKSFLKWILLKPDWFINLVKHFYRWGFINRFLHNFVCFHFGTKEKRDRVFHTWYSLGNFKINPKKVKKLLRQYPISVDMYFGSHDKIIPLSTAVLLSAGMPNIRVFEIDAGHLLVDAKLNVLLKTQLQ